MTAWHRGPMLAFDLETTGPDPDTARIVTATLIECGPDGISNTYEWLIDPGIPIPAGASEIHGVTTEHAQKHGQPAGPALAEILATILAFIGQGPVVAFNAAYDFTVLDREGWRHGKRLVGDGPFVVDPHVIDKQLLWRKGKRTLTAVCDYWGVELTQAHNSLADALAAARLAFVLGERYPAQLDVPLVDLHESQRVWRREQAASLQSYFRSNGKPDAVVNGDWPIQTLPAGWTPEQVDETEEVAS